VGRVRGGQRERAETAATANTSNTKEPVRKTSSRPACSPSPPGSRRSSRVKDGVASNPSKLTLTSSSNTKAIREGTAANGASSPPANPRRPGDPNRK
jgi:hypothetical protein